MTKKLILQDLEDFGFKTMFFNLDGTFLATKKEDGTEVSIILTEYGLSLYIEVLSLLVETCFCSVRNVSFGHGFMFFRSEIAKKEVKLDLKTLGFTTKSL